MKRFKIWEAIFPRSFTANGTTNGIVTIASTQCFYQWQRVIVKATSLPNKSLEIKRILSLTQMVVGPVDQVANRYSALDLYTVGLGASIEAPEQNFGVDYTEGDVFPAVYENHPIAALRSILVDCSGQHYNAVNPFPVTIKDLVVNADVRVKITHLDNSPNPGDIADSTRIGDGVTTATVTLCGDLRTADTLHNQGLQTVLFVTNIPVPIRKFATNKDCRKSVTAVPLGKGICWGFESNVDTTLGVNGGTPLGKKQPLIVEAEANTDVYLVGPPAGVYVAVTEA